MKKFNLVFALFCALFFAVSCDSGIKFNNPNDIHSDAYDPEASKSGENETNDEDIDQAVTDPTDNEPTDTEPDDSDTTLEQPDNGDSEPDESDTTDDGDSSAPDEDADEQDEEPATRTATCSGLPANASWHNGSSITQTFDGNDWYPPATGFYSETAVENECGFKCNQGYEWNGNQCVKPATPCNPNPCTSISNSTGNCTVNGTGYICGCQSGYEWSGNLCIMTAEEECNVAGGNWNASQNECTKTANCPSKPANTVWNDNGANGTYTQT